MQVPYVKNHLKIYKTFESTIIASQAGVVIKCHRDLVVCTVSVSGFYHGQLKGLLGEFFFSFVFYFIYFFCFCLQSQETETTNVSTISSYRTVKRLNSNTISVTRTESGVRDARPKRKSRIVPDWCSRSARNTSIPIQIWKSITIRSIRPTTKLPARTESISWPTPITFRWPPTSRRSIRKATRLSCLKVSVRTTVFVCFFSAGLRKLVFVFGPYSDVHGRRRSKENRRRVQGQDTGKSRRHRNSGGRFRVPTKRFN